MKLFGDILRELRIDRGYTQARFAAKLGVSRKTVILWEQNKALPNILLAADIADLLDCSLDELAGREV